MNIKEIIKLPEYSFLTDVDYLGDNILFVTFGGSHSYGTNVEGSDVDIRGLALNKKSELLSISGTSTEQYVSKQTDTTIYLLNKFVKLCLNCNPNVIEMLGCKPEHYIFYNEIGKQLVDNRKMFLSQRAVYSFGGYANQQLNRLQNALARDRLPQAEKEEHIKRSMESAVRSFNDRYPAFSNDSLELFISDSKKEEFNKELYANLNFSNIPVRELDGILNELLAVVRTYDKLTGRNKKKDDMHMDKHAMHLVRLYLMCFDILEKEDIITYREEDKGFLLSVRKGLFRNEDGTYRKEFFELIDDYDKRLKYDMANTSLPKQPDIDRIDEFVKEINFKTLGFAPV